MKPISRLRTRARSEARSSATGRPFRSYDPCVGESRRPKIDRRVDLPQPDGPAIDTYSPRSIWTLTFESACVSTSSVEKTLVRSCSLMTGGGPFGFMRPPLLLKTNAIEGIPRRHVRQDDLIAHAQPGDDFYRIDRSATELDLRARRPATGLKLEQPDGGLLLPTCGTSDVQDVGHPLELDGPVDAQVGDGSLGQVPGERHIHRDRAILHRRIDARHQ